MPVFAINNIIITLTILGKLVVINIIKFWSSVVKFVAISVVHHTEVISKELPFVLQGNWMKCQVHKFGIEKFSPKANGLSTK